MHGTKTTIQFTGPSHRMSEIWESARLDPLAWLTENRTIQRSTLTTNVVVSLDDYIQVLSGQGDEIELRATNGAVLTGAEYVARRLEDAVSPRQLSTPIADASVADAAVADSTSAGPAGVAGSTSAGPAGEALTASSAGVAGLVGAAAVAGAAKMASVMLKDGDCITLIAPEQGPVNLYRVKRLASSKQRRMLEAETTRCAWPGCGRPASECQVHHLQEFAKGGETNPENMTLLCAYHNGVNGQRGRGRMARISGRVTWLPPGSPGCVETTGRGEPPSPPRRGEPPGH